MTRFPSLLCPIDFSDGSRAALGQAAVIANHFGARLTVMTVGDPLVAAVAASEPTDTSLDADTERALQRFYDDVMAHVPSGPRTVQLRVAVGTPAVEILREAHDSCADLIVMSSRGRRGFRKMFFGSTTERVLRETTVPVLVAPGNREQAVELSELAGFIHEVIAPVDLTGASPAQLGIAAAIADGLAVPLMLTHVLQPVGPIGTPRAARATDAARLKAAQQRLSELQCTVASRICTESLVLSGEPSEEIARIAESRHANLIVMGLHSSGMLGPRMGSVTYRVLCRTNAFVLALPPAQRLRETRRIDSSKTVTDDRTLPELTHTCAEQSLPG